MEEMVCPACSGSQVDQVKTFTKEALLSYIIFSGTHATSTQVIFPSRFQYILLAAGIPFLLHLVGVALFQV